MAKHWTKIRSDVVRSTRMASLLDKNPLAYALYMNAKATCDDYGHMEADPRKFKATACPMSEVTLKKIAMALDAMEASGVIRRYEVAGDTYLEIHCYNEIEDTYWLNVGRPDYPFPADYQPPASLVEFIRAHSENPKVSPERYGLTREQVFGENDAAQTPKRGADKHPHSTCGAHAKHPHSTCGAESETESETKVERKGTRAPARPAPRLSQLPNTPLANAVAAYLGNGPDTVRWHNDLTRQLALPANTVTADQVIAALNSNTAGPVGPETTFADRFIARLARENADANALSQQEAEAVAAQERFILAQRKLIQDAMIAQAEAKQ